MVKKPIAIPVLLSFSLAIGAVLFVLRFDKLPPQIPLFYSLTDGEAIIVDIFYIVIIPLTMLILVSLNILMSRRYYKDNVFIEAIVYWTNIIIIVTLVAVFLKIIFLVT